MNAENYHINLVIDDHEYLKHHFFDNVSIWEEIKKFVPVFVETALDLNCKDVSVHFNNISSIQNISKKEDIQILTQALNNYHDSYYRSYNLHETFSILFNKILIKQLYNYSKEYIVLITTCIDDYKKIFEAKEYINSLKYIRILLFSTNKIEINDPQIKIFHRNYLLSDKVQTIFTLTS